MYRFKGKLLTKDDKVIYQKPDVYPLLAGNQDNSVVTFGCMVHKYFPEPVQIVVRTTEGETTSGLTIFPAVSWGDPNISYTRSGHVTVSSSAWAQNTYQCQITHNSTNIQKTIPKGCTSVNPSVKLSQGSCPGENNLKQVQLVFHMSGYSSQEIDVKWVVNEKETPFVSEVISLGTSNGGYSFIGNVNISQAEWNSGTFYKCKVTDTKTGKVAEDMIRKCSDNIDCLGINLFINRPTAEDLLVHKSPCITCLASNIPKPTGYQFHWTKEGGESLQFTVEDAMLSNNGSYSVTSILTITTDAWHSGTKFICSFTYTGLPSPIIKTIFKDTATRISAPSLAVYPPPSDELSKKEDVTVGCLAYHFSPPEIYITWLKNNEPIPKDFYVTTDPKPEAENNSFNNFEGDKNNFAYSMLRVPYTDWEEDNKYTCLVGHEGLAMNFQQKTIDRNSVNLWRIPKVIIEEGKNIDESQEDTLEVSATFVSLFILSLAYCVMVTFFKVK